LKTPPEHNSWQLFIRLSVGKVPKKSADAEKYLPSLLCGEHSVELLL
jgi:hypothetical protein